MLTLLRLSLPITIEDKNWVDSNFKWLLSIFSVETFLKMPVRLMNEAFFPASEREGIQDFIYYFDKVALWMELSPEKITPVLVEPETSAYQSLLSSSPYMSYEHNTEKFRIQINRELLKSSPHLVASIVHELSYIKLLDTIELTQEDGDIAFLSDLCAVYWGFGGIMANVAFDGRAQYIEGTGEKHWGISAFGYFPLEMWAYSLALFAYLQNDQSSHWAQTLSKEVKPIFNRCLQYLNKTGDCPIDLSVIKEAPSISFRDNYQASLASIDEEIKEHSTDIALLFKRIELNRANNKLEPIFKDLSTILQIDPKQEDALIMRSRLKLELQDYQESLKDAERIIASSPEHIEAKGLRSHALFMLGEIDRALSDTQKLLEVHPEHTEHLLLRAYIWEAKQQWNDAMKDYNICVKLIPTDFRPWMYRGWLRVRLKDISGGQADLNQAIQLNHLDSEAYFYRGVLHRKMGNLLEAMEDLDRALALTPHWQDAEIERKFTAQRQLGITDGDWVELCYFEFPTEIFELRKEFKRLRIKHKIDTIAPSITAHTAKGSVLLVPEWDAEQAWEIFHRMQGNTDFVI